MPNDSRLDTERNLPLLLGFSARKEVYSECYNAAKTAEKYASSVVGKFAVLNDFKLGLLLPA